MRPRAVLAALLASVALVGCNTTPPKPPGCEGELTPINAPTAGALDATRRGG